MYKKSVHFYQSFIFIILSCLFITLHLPSNFNLFVTMFLESRVHDLRQANRITKYDTNLLQRLPFRLTHSQYGITYQQLNHTYLRQIKVDQYSVYSPTANKHYPKVVTDVLKCCRCRTK
jgi:hypothetical protein